MKTATANSIGASLQALCAHAPARSQPEERTRPRAHPIEVKAPAAPRSAASPALVRLTPRQLEVLALLCEGLANKAICRRLDIAPGTVKVHISCIFRELGVTSRLQAVLVARQHGLVGDTRTDFGVHVGDSCDAAAGSVIGRLDNRAALERLVAF